MNGKFPNKPDKFGGVSAPEVYAANSFIYSVYDCQSPLQWRRKLVISTPVGTALNFQIQYFKFHIGCGRNLPPSVTIVSIRNRILF